MGSACGTVGRVVVSVARGSLFKSGHVHLLKSGQILAYLTLKLCFRDILYFQFNCWPSDCDEDSGGLANSGGDDVIRFVEMAAVSKRELLGPVLVYSR